MTAIALDDERPALDLIEAFAAEVPGLRLAGVFTSVTAAREVLAKAPPDLVFLDVDMPGASGLDVARELPAGTQVIFTTAHARYAAESYEVAATDYLVKPFTPARFAEAVARALAKHQPAERVLDVRVDNGVERVRLAEVTHAAALDNYVRIYRAGHERPLTVRMTLRQLGAALDEVAGAGAFLQVHRSYLVRASAVRGVRSRRLLIGDAEVPLGATYRAAVREALGA